MIEKILERLEERKSRYKDLVSQDNFNGDYEGERKYTAKVEMCEELVKIVQEVAKDGGWIPCSERLPKENGLEHYEITFLSGIKKVPFRGVAIFSKGRWYMAGTNCRDCDRFPFEVIAWKEPSAPYQKGE